MVHSTLQTLGKHNAKKSQATELAVKALFRMPRMVSHQQPPRAAHGHLGGLRSQRGRGTVPQERDTSYTRPISAHPAFPLGRGAQTSPCLLSTQRMDQKLGKLSAY